MQVIKLSNKSMSRKTSGWGAVWSETVEKIQWNPIHKIISPFTDVWFGERDSGGFQQIRIQYKISRLTVFTQYYDKVTRKFSTKNRYD